MTDSAFYRLQGEIWLISISLIFGLAAAWPSVHTFWLCAHIAGGAPFCGNRRAIRPPATRRGASPLVTAASEKILQVHCPGSKNVNWSGHDSIDNASFLSSGLISGGGTVTRSVRRLFAGARGGPARHQDTDYNAPLTGLLRTRGSRPARALAPAGAAVGRRFTQMNARFSGSPRAGAGGICW